MSARDRRTFRPVTGWRAMLAVLLLMVMPLGLLHRSSSGGCRQMTGAGSVEDVRQLLGHDFGSAPSAVANRLGAVLETTHDHQAIDLSFAESVPGTCGPAALDSRAVPSGTQRPVDAPAEWRASAPALLAAPPPAPPPRLS